MSLANLKSLLPPARGAVAQPVVMTVLRELTLEDLARLPLAPPSGPAVIKQARAVHHRQAQLVAEGRTNIEVATIIGCTPQRISDLKKDPTFQNLMAYYSTQLVETELETHRRIQGKLTDVLELAVDELQERLEDDAKRTRLSFNELRKAAEFAADRTVAPPKGTTNVGLPPAKIELNFGFKRNQSDAVSDAVVAPEIVDITPNET